MVCSFSGFESRFSIKIRREPTGPQNLNDLNTLEDEEFLLNPDLGLSTSVKRGETPSFAGGAGGWNETNYYCRYD